MLKRSFMAGPGLREAPAFERPGIQEPPAREFANGFQPTVFCNFFEQGRCTKGDACTYAHRLEELMGSSTPSLGMRGRPPPGVQVGGFQRPRPTAAVNSHRIDQEFPSQLFDYAQTLDGEGEEATIAPRTFMGGFKPARMCQFFLQSRCQKGLDCSFAHSPLEMAEAPEVQGGMSGLRETQTSLDALLVGMPEADVAEPGEDDEGSQFDIAFGHILDEPRNFERGSQPLLLCTDWLRHPGLCKAEQQCEYAHGLIEMGHGKSKRLEIQLFSAPGATVRTPQANSGKAMGGKAGGGKAGGGYLAFANRPALAALPAAGMGPQFWGREGPEMQAGGAGSARLQLGNRVSRFPPHSPFVPSKICSHWRSHPQSCTKGDQCSFAHGVHELQPSSPEVGNVSRFLHTGFTPKRMCNFFAEGLCQKGFTCSFAHCETELAEFNETDV